MRYDSEGDELDEDDEDSEADAAVAEENPFSEIALEREFLDHSFDEFYVQFMVTDSLPCLPRSPVSSEASLRNPHPPFNVPRLYFQGPPEHDPGYRNKTPPRTCSFMAREKSLPRIPGR